MYFNFEIFLSSVITIFIGFITYFTFKIYNLRKKYSHIPGPVTKGILGFYFGNMFDFIKNKQKNRVDNDLIIDWLNLYGKTIKYQLLSEVLVVTVDHKAIKVIIILSIVINLLKRLLVFIYNYIIY